MFNLKPLAGEGVSHVAAVVVVLNEEAARETLHISGVTHETNGGFEALE